MLRSTFLAFIVLCNSIAFAQEKRSPKQAQPKIDYEQIGAPMPPMLLVTMDSVNKKDLKKRRKARYLVSPYFTKMYTGQQFDNDANLLVMMFNPNCGHCEDMVDQFVANIDSFKKSKLVLMANNQMKVYLPNFATAHKTKEHADVITLGSDSTDFIKNTFLYQPLPQINIYNADRKLIKVFTGTVSIDSLMLYIQ